MMMGAASAADISTYTPSGSVQTIGTGSDLSGGAYLAGYGAVYVDNKTGVLTLPDGFGTCFVGGDLEAVAFLDEDHVLLVNESLNGITVKNKNTCSTVRRFKVDLARSGSDGIEGIEYKDGIIYVLDERSSTVYSFADTGGSSTVTPQVLFTVPNCPNAGDLTFNGDNLVVVCEASFPLAVEYTLDGDYVSQIDNTSIGNGEVIYFTEDELCIGGEPNQLLCFTSDDVTPPPPPPVPVFEDCTVTGTVVRDAGTGETTGTVDVICPTASGTAELDEIIN